jgi:hypothetical protein
VNECEICLEPDSAKVIVTIQLPEVPPHPIAFCDECLCLVFTAMVGRYNMAVREHNEEVRGIMRVLGLEVPS